MRADLDKLFDIPYQFVKTEIVTRIPNLMLFLLIQSQSSGHPNPSFLLSYLEEKNGQETTEEEELVQAFATALYSGQQLLSKVLLGWTVI